MAVATRLNIDPTNITTTLLFVETGMAVRTLSLNHLQLTADTSGVQGVGSGT